MPAWSRSVTWPLVGTREVRRRQSRDLRYLGPDERKTWPHAAASFIVRWTRGVQVQHDTILRTAPGRGDDLAHEFYAIALMNLLRAVRLARDTAPTAEVRDAVDQEIEDFEKAVPALKPIRDIVEHFDDYAIGAGDLQWNDGATKPRFTLYDGWYTRDPDADQAGIRIGTYELDTSATAAATELAERVLDHLLPDGEPDATPQQIEQILRGLAADGDVV